MKRKYHRLTETDRDRIVTLYADGHTFHHIISALDSSYKAVRDTLRARAVVLGRMPHYAKLPAAQLGDLIKNYATCKSVKATATRFKISQPMVRRLLAMAHVALRRAHKKRHYLSPTIRRQIRSAFTSGMFPSDIIAKFDISWSELNRELRRNGIARKLPTDEHKRRLNIDQSAFDAVTSESAYWAGFLFADGNVYGKYVRLGLAIADIDHVRAFRRFLRSECTIGVADQTRSTYGAGLGKVARMAVHSKRLVDALARYGVVPRKSLTATVPAIVEDNPHFWRGVIDGDGSIHCGPSARLMICGSLATCVAFADFLRRAGLSESARVSGPKSSIYRVEVYGLRKLAEICKRLYPVGAIALPRKKARADRLVARSIRGHGRRIDDPSRHDIFTEASRSWIGRNRDK